MASSPTDSRFFRVTVLSLPIFALAVVWILHVVLTELDDPLGLGFDSGLWIVASLLKMLSLVAVGALLASVYQAIAGNAKAVCVALLVWSLLGTGTIVGLAMTREFWGPRFSDDAVKYYSIGNELPAQGGYAEHWRQWKQDWSSGKVVLAEIGLVIVLAGTHSLIGFYLGKHLPVAIALGYSVTAVLLIFYDIGSGWHVSDYDEFHGDIFPSAIMYDHRIFLVAMDTYTTLSLAIYLAVAVSALTIVYQVNRIARQGC